MPDFTAKDVQALRQATGAGMMDAKKALQENDGDMEAAAQWLREKGLAKVAKLGDRENSAGRGGGRGRRQRRRHRRAQERDRLRGQVRRLHLARAGPGRAGAGQGRRRRRPSGPPSSTTSRSPRRRTSSSGRVVRFEAGEGNLLDSYLHIQDGRGVNARAGRAGRRHPRAGPRHRRAHRLRQAAVPDAATRCPADAVDEGAPGAARHHQGRGQARAGLAQDRRGPAQRLVQGPGAARAGVRPRRQDDRSPSCSATPPIVRFAQVVHRRDADRRGSTGPALATALVRVLLKLSGEAFAGEGGYGIDGARGPAAGHADRRGPPRPRHRRGHRGRRRQHLAGHDRRRRGHGPGPGRLHGHAGHRHQRPGPPGHPRAARPAHPGPDRHPDGRRSPSPTSAAGPSATSRRVASSSSPAAPATRSSPPTPPPPCGPSRSRPACC